MRNGISFSGSLEKSRTETIKQGFGCMSCHVQSAIVRRLNISSYQVEHVIFPALRQMFAPPRRLADQGAALKVADLKDLYKVTRRGEQEEPGSALQRSVQRVLNSVFLCFSL